MRTAITLPIDTRSPIFIGGQRDSGTALIGDLLNHHPHIACGPGGTFIQDPAFVAWHDRIQAEWSERIDRFGMGSESFDRAMAALVDELFTRHQMRQGKPRWADKTPTNILRIDYLFHLFPHAQFIHVVRDPRDVYCSIHQHLESDNEESIWLKPKGYARDWRAAILAGEPWREQPDRYREICYEDLVHDPEAVMRTVLAFLGEPWDPRVLDPEADDSGARADTQVWRDPTVSNSVGRWRTQSSRDDVALIEQIAGPYMSAWGYQLLGETVKYESTSARHSF